MGVVGVSALEFLGDEIKAYFFKKSPVSFKGLPVDDKLKGYIERYQNLFFHRRPELDMASVQWYNKDFQSVPTEIKPSLEALIELINLI